MGAWLFSRRWEVSLALNEDLHMFVVAEELFGSLVYQYDWTVALVGLKRNGYRNKRPGRNSSRKIPSIVTLGRIGRMLWEVSMGFDPTAHYQQHVHISPIDQFIQNNSFIRKLVSYLPSPAQVLFRENCWYWSVGAMTKAYYFSSLPF